MEFPLIDPVKLNSTDFIDTEFPFLVYVPISVTLPESADSRTYNVKVDSEVKFKVKKPISVVAVQVVPTRESEVALFLLQEAKLAKEAITAIAIMMETIIFFIMCLFLNGFVVNGFLGYLAHKKKCEPFILIPVVGSGRPAKRIKK